MEEEEEQKKEEDPATPTIPRKNQTTPSKLPYLRYPPSLSEITAPQYKTFASKIQVLRQLTTPARTCYRWSGKPCTSWENARNPRLAPPQIQKWITNLYWSCNIPCTIPPAPGYSKRPTFGSLFPKRIWMETPAWRSILTNQNTNQIHYHTPSHWLPITPLNLPLHWCC